MSNASFSWDEKTNKIILHDINLKIEPGQLVAIIGNVGSGKSSLLLATLNEMPKLSGELYTKVYAFLCVLYETNFFLINSSFRALLLMFPKRNLGFSKPLCEKTYFSGKTSINHCTIMSLTVVL